MTGSTRTPEVCWTIKSCSCLQPLCSLLMQLCRTADTCMGRLEGRLQLYLLIQLLYTLWVVLVLPAGPHRPPELVVEALRRSGDGQRGYEQLLLQVALTDAPAQSAQQRFTTASCRAPAERCIASPGHCSTSETASIGVATASCRGHGAIQESRPVEAASCKRTMQFGLGITC